MADLIESIDLSHRLHIKLSSSDSTDLFWRYIYAIEERYQIERGPILDGIYEMYQDFNLKGVTLILHVEELEGISIHIKDGSDDALLREVARFLLGL